MTAKYWTRFLMTSLVLVAGLNGCTMGPDYQRPEATVPAAYREESPWKEAAPADDLDRAPGGRLMAIRFWTTCSSAPRLQTKACRPQ